MDKLRFNRVVDKYRKNGEHALSDDELGQFHFERYQTLCALFYLKTNKKYRDQISICATSEKLYNDIPNYINRISDVNYLRFYLVVLLNELELDCDWLVSLEVDLPFRLGLVSREIRNVFEIKGL